MIDERARRGQMARTAAALFGAASVVTLLGIVLPHEPHLDREGNAAGDAALVTLARELTGALSEVDAVARLGGDEFAALLPETGLRRARAAAERLAASTSVAVSIGTAVYGLDGHTIDELGRAADSALCSAKRRVEPRAPAAR